VIGGKLDLVGDSERIILPIEIGGGGGQFFINRGQDDCGELAAAAPPGPGWKQAGKYLIFSCNERPSYG
jgi:hypothetical protein